MKENSLLMFFVFDENVTAQFKPDNSAQYHRILQRAPE